MKKIMILFFAGALTGAFGVACDNNKSLIQPVSGNADVTAFFEEYLMLFFDEFDQHEEVCLTIDSAEEFRAIAPSSIELPYIDFDKNTIVIGRYSIPSGGYVLKNQNIDTKPDVMKLNLVFENTGKGLSAVFWPNYWSLFPKLPQKPIAFNLVFKNEK